MVACYGIKFDGQEDKTLVLIPNGVYMLPDERLAELVATLVWCDNCGTFNAGESIESASDIESRIAAAKRGVVPRVYQAVFAGAPKRLRREIECWERRLHWRRLRISPPKCLVCGSTRVVHVNCDDPASLTTTVGKSFSAECAFASTSIDDRLSLFSSEGVFVGEISALDSTSHKRMDDSSPYASILERLQEQTLA
jgi:hypothetical protein